MKPINKRILTEGGLFLLVIIILVGGIFYFLKNNPNILKNFTTRKGAISDKITMVNLNRINSDLALKKYDIALPKSKVSEAYYATFNNIINEAAIMDGSYKGEMAPALTKVKEFYDKKNYSRLPSLATQIRELNQTQKDRTDILYGYLRSLSVINGDITDSETKSLTAGFIASGLKMADAFKAYGLLVDTVLSGSNLDAHTVSQTKITAENLQSSLVEFEKSTEALVSFFSKILKADLQAKTAATSSKAE